VAEKYTLWFFGVAIAAIENEHVFFGESHQSSINNYKWLIETNGLE